MLKLGILADCTKNVPELHKDALLCEPVLPSENKSAACRAVNAELEEVIVCGYTKVRKSSKLK